MKTPAGCSPPQIPRAGRGTRLLGLGLGLSSAVEGTAVSTEALRDPPAALLVSALYHFFSPQQTFIEHLLRASSG